MSWLPQGLRASTVAERARSHLREHQRARLHALLQVEAARLYLKKAELAVDYHDAVIETLQKELS